MDWLDNAPAIFLLRVDTSDSPIQFRFVSCDSMGRAVLRSNPIRLTKTNQSLNETNSLLLQPLSYFVTLLLIRRFSFEIFAQSLISYNLFVPELSCKFIS